jgi:topoisomerase-4 subunit A
VKGFKALGNQLTTEKIKQVNILESLPYEVPQEILLERRNTNDDGTDFQRDEDGKSYFFNY